MGQPISVFNVVSTFVRKSAAEEPKSKQLSMGCEIEKEHKDVFDLLNKAFEDAGAKMPVTEDAFYEMVAKAHLKELPDYYTRLKKMESVAEKEAMDFSTIAPVQKTEKPLDPRETARAIRQAICAEHDAVHLYELIADSCPNKDVKELLQDIADEEAVHIGELQHLLSILDTDSDKLLEEGREEAKDTVG
jgi:rubrerythrin